MNRNYALALVLVLATAAAGNAFADDITVDPTPFVSTMSRADVKAELQQFRNSGIDPWSQTYDQLAGFRSDRTRAEVTAAYIAQRDRVAAFNGEDSGSMFMARATDASPVDTDVAAMPADAE
jgi:hypothetical protein